MPLVELRCAAAAATVADRLRRGAASGTGASDADQVIAAALAADADSWFDAHTIVTDYVPDHVLRDALTITGRFVHPAGATVG